MVSYKALAGFVVLCAAVLGAGEPAPEQVAPLASMLDQEKHAMDALRDFDLLQQKLFDWDIAIARDLQAKGDEVTAQAKIDDAQRRMDTIRLAYEQFLDRYPENGRANNYYGEFLYDRIGDQQEALRRWKMAEQFDPKLSMPLNNLAIHYCHEGFYEFGFDYLDRALELEPDNPDYLFNAVQIYLTNSEQAKEHYGWDDKKLYREAMKMSQRAAELAPDDFQVVQDYAVNFFVSERFGVEGSWREAADAWARARTLAVEPDDVYFTWLNEARTAVLAGQLGRAGACLEEARKYQPDSSTIRKLQEEIDRRRK